MNFVILIYGCLFTVAYGFTRKIFDNEKNCIGMENIIKENILGFKICCNDNFTEDDAEGETKYPDSKWEDAIAKEYEAIVRGKTNCAMIGTYPVKLNENSTNIGII